VRETLTDLLLEASGVTDRAGFAARTPALGVARLTAPDGPARASASELRGEDGAHSALAPQDAEAAPSSAEPEPRREPAAPTSGLPNVLIASLVALGLLGVAWAVTNVPRQATRAASARVGTETVPSSEVEALVAEARAASTAEELARQGERLLGDDRREIRRAAALFLREHPSAEAVDPVLRAVADLELARGCRGYEEALRTLVRLGDARALPAVERLADRPKRGCGEGRRRDCIACVRPELGIARAQLRAAAEAPSPP
ncbi:MAG: hypothetical protein AAF447_26460, partial [Myxococcota bacterium]